MTPDQEHTFTAALYLFSTLLQADAALMGFGGVFLLFRLQHRPVRDTKDQRRWVTKLVWAIVVGFILHMTWCAAWLYAAPSEDFTNPHTSHLLRWTIYSFGLLMSLSATFGYLMIKETR